MFVWLQWYILVEGIITIARAGASASAKLADDEI